MFVGVAGTIGGQPVRLSCLGVGGVDGRLLHAAELGLAGVRGHGRGRRRGEDVGVGSGGGEGEAGHVGAVSLASHAAGRTYLEG